MKVLELENLTIWNFDRSVNRSCIWVHYSWASASGIYVSRNQGIHVVVPSEAIRKVASPALNEILTSLLLQALVQYTYSVKGVKIETNIRKKVC